MAIDTKAKRMSMLYVASPIVWGAHFEVDGAVDADDRMHLLHIYGGLFDTGAAAAGSTSQLMLMGLGT